MAWISFGALPCKKKTWWQLASRCCWNMIKYRGADKSIAWPGSQQANVSVRMAWISFGVLPCRGKKTWWQLASRCCWNRARPWHASELVPFLVGLRTYQLPGTVVLSLQPHATATHPAATVTDSNASFVGASAKLRKATISFVVSVCPSAWNISAPNGQIIMEFDIWVLLESMSIIFKCH